MQPPAHAHAHALALALFSATCGAAATAVAHAPLSRNAAVSADGASIAVHAPGFGLVVRAQDRERFAYACDALLGIAPSAPTDPVIHVPLVYVADGDLLVGTPSGLRRLSGAGCPLSGGEDLRGASIVALAVHARDPLLAYALTAGSQPELYRSTDGGVQWTARQAIPNEALGALTSIVSSALVLSASDPELLYISVSTESSSTLLRSEDGGASLVMFPQEQAVTLLHVEPGATGGLWARMRDASTREAVIMRADLATGPWSERLRVNFFGGFAADEQGIWVGDEGGSIFRSTDGGASFEDVQPSKAVACLLRSADTLWGCTPGSTRQPAFAMLSDDSTMLEPITTFGEIDELVDCAPELDVMNVCAPAWNEWRVDVQMQGAVPDAGPDMPPDMAPDMPPDMPPDAMADAAMPLVTSSGCAVVAARSAAPGGAAMCVMVALLLCVRRWRLASPSESTTVRAMEPPQPDVDREARSDQALMARAVLGDAEAFAEIYDGHAPALLALAQRMLASAADAQDLLHDVFLEAWQRLREYDASRASVRTWLIVRLRSRALDRRARAARQAQAVQAELEPSARASADATVLAPEQQLAVRHALEALDADVRAVLELTFFEGLTAVEIAARNGAPLGTVKSRLARGLTRLHALLRELEETMP